MEMLILAMLIATAVVRYGVTDLVATARGTESPRHRERMRRTELEHERAVARGRNRSGPTIGEAVATRIASRVAAPKPPKDRSGSGPFRQYVGSVWEDSWNHAVDRRRERHERKAAEALRAHDSGSSVGFDHDPPPAAEAPSTTWDGQQYECDGTCVNSNTEDACGSCDGSGHRVWNFGHEHGHSPCPECNPDGPRWVRPRLEPVGQDEDLLLPPDDTGVGGGRYAPMDRALADDEDRSGNDPHKPFAEYTDAEWRRYYAWSARALRRHADEDDATGREPREVTDRWRAAAEQFEQDSRGETINHNGGTTMTAWDNSGYWGSGPEGAAAAHRAGYEHSSPTSNGGTMGEIYNPESAVADATAVSAGMGDLIAQLESSLSGLVARNVSGPPVDAYSAMIDSATAMQSTADEAVEAFKGHQEIKDVIDSDPTIGDGDYVEINA